MLLKVGLSAVFTQWRIPLSISYLLIQLLILFFSFLYHFRITFGRRYDSWETVSHAFGVYVPSVIVFKVLDYLLVVCGAAYLKAILCEHTELTMYWQQIVNSGSILAVSVLIFAIRFVVYKLIFCKRTPADLTDYTGPVREIRTGYCSDPEIAGNAASGGIVTGLLTDLLKQGKINGALLTRFEFREGKPEARGFIATTQDEICASQGSVYLSFPLLSRDSVAALRAFPGKLAVVGLPCQCSALRKLLERDASLWEKIVLIVGLFCGHTSQPELLLRVLRKKNIAPEEVAAYRFRRGLFRGEAVVTLKDGSQRRWPTAFFNLYQNLFILSAPQCSGCFDHYAECADISCGDIWTWKHRRDTVKHSIFCSRTEIGEQLLREAVANRVLTAETATHEELFKANIRAAIYHKAIRARAEALARCGKTIQIPPNARPARWNERLAARIAVRFQNMPPDKALAINRRILKFWLYLFKGLTNF